MCEFCGCSVDHDHHHHDHDHHHHHEHEHRVLQVQQDILHRNDHLAAHNRELLRERGVLALNLVSSPGAGKTTLVEQMVRDLRNERRILVIEGDQATDRDAARVRAAGAQAVQINTGTGCHLDASMVGRALGELEPRRGDLVIIENVGNLVCPALFDLGEHAKVVVASVPEGDDKPAKYPHMFRQARLMLLNKIDLMPHVSFDLERCVQLAHEVNPALAVLAVSATRGDGLADFYRWMRSVE